MAIGRSPTLGVRPFVSGAPATKAATPGRTRTCPHCKATILDSAAVCPGCQHHLRYDPTAVAEQKAASTLVPLKVEGTVRHPADGEAWEYTVVLAIRNEKGEEVTRQVVGVGALQKSEFRSFTLSVEVVVPPGSGQPKP